MIYRYIVRKQDLDDPSDFEVFVKMAQKEFKNAVTSLGGTLYFDAEPGNLKRRCNDRGLKTTWIDILTTSDLTPHID